jgi:exosortase
MDPSPLNKYGKPLALSLLGLCLLWSYWPTLGELAGRWSHDPQYSHGYLVPVFALYLIWRQRRQLAEMPVQSSRWGLALVAAGAALRLAGAYVFFPWLDALSLLPVLAGVCLLIGGWPALRRCWPAIAFLAFMLPLPYQLQTALAQPLQRTATLASVYLLETLGLPAVARGNIILINDTRIGVVEACNGLSMLVTFFALSTAVVLLIRRGLAERAAVLLGAIPIAVAANVLRITVTAILMETVGADAAGVFFHDLAGWLMMPLGLAMMGLELLIVRCLLVEDRTKEPGIEPPRGEAAAAPHGGERPQQELAMSPTA